MAKIVQTVSTDEKTYQIKFYEAIFGENNLDGNVFMDRSTDGYTKGILFEHKTNIKSYGNSKALGQALIYLSRFNRDGIPVPSKICLVSQNENKCYIYNTKDYLKYIENIVEYANLKGSDSIPGFEAGAPCRIINFDITSFAGMKELGEFAQQAPEYTKVHIDEHNVYGWSGFFYTNAEKFKQKPEKKVFFEELKNPQKTLKNYIHPWTGKETDFKYIMDMLNDPQTQKDLGAFYTPPIYSKKAVELVKMAIERVPEGNDYIILDRCAGTGNLEMYLDFSDDILSHVIVSTYELKEWMVLKDRFGKRVRYIIPPIPDNKDDIPELNEKGFLRGANALEEDIINNKEILKYVNDPKCTIIIFENPPFVENTQVVKSDGKTIVQKKTSTWKNTTMSEYMKKEVQGAALNDMGNVFIWSGFKYFLRQPTDSYIVFSPIKYWKAHHLIKKKFVKGFAFNRKHFHADATCVTCIYWSNEDDVDTNEITLESYDIENDSLKKEEDIKVKQVFSTLSEKYYDGKILDTDKKEGFVCEIDGTISNKKPVGITPITSDDIIGYLVAYKNTFDSPRYCSMLLRGGIYNGHGFYLRKDNFIEKLPLFAASRYTDYCNSWKIMSMVMKSGDKSERYKKDIADGKLNDFLFKTLFWACTTHHAHMRSLQHNSEFYLNEICLDHNNNVKTLGESKLDNFIKNGISLSDEEKIIYNKMQHILEFVKKNCKDEYNPKFKYGLYQIDEEINIKIQVDTKSDGTPIMGYKYGDLNNMIKEIKPLIKNYYIENIVPTLFKYEFLK